MDTYRMGKIGERKIMNNLDDKGFENIRRSAGSRGPADIYAVKDGTKYYVQAKTRSARTSSEEIEDLRALAKKRHGVAVVISYDRGKSKWHFYGNWS